MSIWRFVPVLVGVMVWAITLWASLTPVRAAEADLFAAMRATRVLPPAPAPDLVLPTVDGGSLRLTELRGKVLILGFFVTT